MTKTFVRVPDGLPAGTKFVGLYRGPSTSPPSNPPSGSLWSQTDLGRVVQNIGTAAAPNWQQKDVGASQASETSAGIIKASAPSADPKAVITDDAAWQTARDHPAQVGNVHGLTASDIAALGGVTQQDFSAHVDSETKHDIYGNIVDRPAPDATKSGRRYWAYDEGVVYRDTGTAWEKQAVRDWDDIDGKPPTFPPTAHGASHATGGSDPLAPADIGAVPTGRQVLTGAGLTGGGDLSADRTVAHGSVPFEEGAAGQWFDYASVKLDERNHVIGVRSNTPSGTPPGSTTQLGAVKTSSDPAPGADPVVLMQQDYVPGVTTSRQIATAAPLSGGGDLSVDRTIALNTGGVTFGHLHPNAFPWSDVRKHGAIGDGVANDSPAFQAAIDAVFAAGGGVVFVPAGRWRLGGPVTVRSNVALVGVGVSVPDSTNPPGGETIAIGSLRASVLLVDWGEAHSANSTTGSITAGQNALTVAAVSDFAVGQQVRVSGAAANRGFDLIASVTAVDSVNRVLTLSENAGTTVTDAAVRHWSGYGITLRGNAPTLYGLVIHYPNQVLPTATTPVTYPPTVGLANENVKTPTVRETLITNAFHGVFFDTAHNRPIIDMLWLGAYFRGVTVNRAVDTPRISNVHATAFYDLVHGYDAGANSIDSYVQQNLIVFDFGRGDWFYTRDLFAWQCRVGVRLRVGDATNGNTTLRVSRGHCYNLKVDKCGQAILATATDSGPGWHFIGGEFSVAYAPNVGIQTAAETVAGTVYLPHLRVQNFNIGGAAAAQHVLHQAGRLSLEGCNFYAAATSENVRVGNGTNLDSFRMAHCDFYAASGIGLTILNASPARTILEGNDLRNVTYTAPGTLPPVYKAGGNQGIVSAGW